MTVSVAQLPRGFMLHVYNLFLAGIWTALGVGLLIYHAVQPNNAMAFRFGDTNVSLGWVALALAVYNLLRWWGRRASYSARQQQEEFQRRREVARRDREFRASGQEPDPNFIFDEPPRPQP
jgi:hypothetical protein